MLSLIYIAYLNKFKNPFIITAFLRKIAHKLKNESP